MNKKSIRKLMATCIIFTMIVASTVTSYAAEDINVETTCKKEVKEQMLANGNLADFSGIYYGTVPVKFHVDDSTKVVKVLYNVRRLDGSTPKSSIGIKRDGSRLYGFTKLYMSGNSQVIETGQWKTGDYLLEIKVSDPSSGFAITGQVYYK